MINLLTIEPAEAERIAYAEGFTMAAELFKRINDLELELELERDALQKLVRYFVIDFDLENGPDLVEVDEREFLRADGRITYERHTVRENGVNQICLTKGLDE